MLTKIWIVIPKDATLKKEVFDEIIAHLRYNMGFEDPSEPSISQQTNVFSRYISAESKGLPLHPPFRRLFNTTGRKNSNLFLVIL